jgi:hypothetical protein
LAAFRQIDEIPDGFRAFRSVEFGFKRALVGFENGHGPVNGFFVIHFFKAHDFLP